MNFNEPIRIVPGEPTVSLGNIEEYENYFDESTLTLAVGIKTGFQNGDEQVEEDEFAYDRYSTGFHRPSDVNGPGWRRNGLAENPNVAFPYETERVNSALLRAKGFYFDLPEDAEIEDIVCRTGFPTRDFRAASPFVHVQHHLFRCKEVSDGDADFVQLLFDVEGAYGAPPGDYLFRFVGDNFTNYEPYESNTAALPARVRVRSRSGSGSIRVDGVTYTPAQPNSEYRVIDRIMGIPALPAGTQAAQYVRIGVPGNGSTCRLLDTYDLNRQYTYYLLDFDVLFGCRLPGYGEQLGDLFPGGVDFVWERDIEGCQQAIPDSHKHVTVVVYGATYVGGE